MNSPPIVNRCAYRLGYHLQWGRRGLLAAMDHTKSATIDVRAHSDKREHLMLLRTLGLAALGSAIFLGGPATAQSLPTAKLLPLTLANEAALEAVAACEKSGYRVTATVVDASGLVKAVAKGDGAPPHTLDSSRGKAYGAVSLGPNFGESLTSAVVARVSGGPALGALQHLPGVFLVAGGVVLKSGEQVVGAIGVGGAPGGDKDEVCAKAAAEKIADRLK
jgi:uncharacterized protein GlcG (DUF336 family)